MRHVVTTRNLGHHISICLQEEENQEKPVSRCQAAGTLTCMLSSNQQSGMLKRKSNEKDEFLPHTIHVSKITVFSNVTPCEQSSGI